MEAFMHKPEPCPFVDNCVGYRAAPCYVMLPDEGCYLYRWFKKRIEEVEKKESEMTKDQFYNARNILKDIEDYDDQEKRLVSLNNKLMLAEQFVHKEISIQVRETGLETPIVIVSFDVFKRFIKK